MARRGIESAPSFGGGRPLDDAPRSFMEARFGRNFAGVRIHTDGEAAASARALNARAYTFGRDIVFASGAYRPESGEGRGLLAHELAHVVQQDQEARPTVIWRQSADASTSGPTPGATPPPATATAGGQPTADRAAGLIVEDYDTRPRTGPDETRPVPVAIAAGGLQHRRTGGGKLAHGSAVAS